MIKFQKWIVREDLQRNPDVLYLFGDNFARKGYGGQAKEMRGEPNSLGIITKVKPSMGADAFFSESNIQQTLAQLKMIAEDLDHAERFLRAGGTIVIPQDGLGTGLSELSTRAPRAHQFIEDWNRRMCQAYMYRWNVEITDE